MPLPLLEGDMQTTHIWLYVLSGDAKSAYMIGWQTLYL